MRIDRMYGKWWALDASATVEASTLDTNHGAGAGLEWLTKGGSDNTPVMGPFETEAEARQALEEWQSI